MPLNEQKNPLFKHLWDLSSLYLTGLLVQDTWLILNFHLFLHEENPLMFQQKIENVQKMGCLIFSPEIRLIVECDHVPCVGASNSGKYGISCSIYNLF